MVAKHSDDSGGHNDDGPRYPTIRQTFNEELMSHIRKARKMPCLFDSDGRYRPNGNICAAEGCFAKACIFIYKETQ